MDQVTREGEQSRLLVVENRSEHALELCHTVIWRENRAADRKLVRHLNEQVVAVMSEHVVVRLAAGLLLSRRVSGQEEDRAQLAVCASQGEVRAQLAAIRICEDAEPFDARVAVGRIASVQLVAVAAPLEIRII